MEMYQRSKMNMFMTLRDCFIANLKLFNALVNFPTKYTLFNTKTTAVFTCAEKHGIDKSGLTESKEEAKENLIELTYSSASRLYLFAKSNNKKELEIQAKISLSDLKRKPGLDLKAKATEIYDDGQLNLTALTPFGTTATTQTALLNAINLFTDLIPKPRTNTVTKTQDTTALKKAIQEADDVISDIDDIVDTIRFINPELYATYFQARKIIEQGTQSLTIQGKVIDDETGLPIAKAKIELYPLFDESVSKVNNESESNNESKSKNLSVSESIKAKEKEPILKKSAEKGGFNIKSVTHNRYRIVCSKALYITYDGIQELTLDELNKLTIRLKKK